MIREHIQEPFNPIKQAKEDTIRDVETISPKETTPLFQHKADYKGDINQKTHGSDDSPSKTDVCVRNLVKEHENEDD